jgi:hypothetical protein
MNEHLQLILSKLSTTDSQTRKKQTLTPKHNEQAEISHQDTEQQTTDHPPQHQLLLTQNPYNQNTIRRRSVQTTLPSILS